jgi:hypothetical protein
MAVKGHDSSANQEINNLLLIVYQY